jgi:hypothetical protein
VRFDHRAIEPAHSQKTSSRKKETPSEKATGDYKVVLDEMVAAMNIPTDVDQDVAVKQPKPAPVTKHDAQTASVITDVGISTISH